jgi:hypothetical protein
MDRNCVRSLFNVLGVSDLYSLTLSCKEFLWLLNDNDVVWTLLVKRDFARAIDKTNEKQECYTKKDYYDLCVKHNSCYVCGYIATNPKKFWVKSSDTVDGDFFTFLKSVKSTELVKVCKVCVVHKNKVYDEVDIGSRVACDALDCKANKLLPKRYSMRIVNDSFNGGSKYFIFLGEFIVSQFPEWEPVPDDCQDKELTPFDILPVDSTDDIDILETNWSKSKAILEENLKILRFKKKKEFCDLLHKKRIVLNYEDYTDLLSKYMAGLDSIESAIKKAERIHFFYRFTDFQKIWKKRKIESLLLRNIAQTRKDAITRWKNNRVGRYYFPKSLEKYL